MMVARVRFACIVTFLLLLPCLSGDVKGQIIQNLVPATTPNTPALYTTGDNIFVSGSTTPWAIKMEI